MKTKTNPKSLRGCFFSSVVSSVLSGSSGRRRWKLPPPPTSQVHTRIDDPGARNRQGPAGAPIRSFGWHDPYHIRFVVYVPNLTPGLYRLRI